MTERQLLYDLERFGDGWRIVDEAGVTVERFAMAETVEAIAELDRLNAPVYAAGSPEAHAG